MCGIVGLLIKKSSLRERLGELMVPMLVGMTDRGPDSAGMAVFSEPVPEGQRKVNIYCTEPAFDWRKLEASLRERFGKLRLDLRINHAILLLEADPASVREWLEVEHPNVHVLSTGRGIDLYKDVGLPAQIASRYEFDKLRGTHLVGHTRMATESAVTPANAHPYTAGEDWCLVHNGSLANPYSLKRMLQKRGIRFESDCDTEAACRYLDWRLRDGDDLETALHHAFEDFDGFFTFLMGTQDKLALVRDPFACKPAVVAETDEYVAIASEFRSLAHLPGIKSAQVFEPKPAEIYSWSV
jgi:methylamine---glutamate N-methyltransferase subunit A